MSLSVAETKAIIGKYFPLLKKEDYSITKWTVKPQIDIMLKLSFGWVKQEFYLQILFLELDFWLSQMKVFDQIFKPVYPQFNLLQKDKDPDVIALEKELDEADKDINKYLQKVKAAFQEDV